MYLKCINLYWHALNGTKKACLMKKYSSFMSNLFGKYLRSRISSYYAK